MDASESRSEIHQVIVKLLDGKHRILHFDSPSIFISALKSRIETITSIPSALQLLTSGSRNLYDDQTLIIGQSGRNPQFPADSSIGLDGFSKFPLTVHLLLRLRGGKGGFGSLLRGAATKAGQKKTNNFDACRDMSGRRLRHVNAEKKLEEWRAEADERKLEKMAEDFLKKKAKENKRSGKGNGGDGAEKYVAKYREDSEKCMEEVERSVRASVKGLMSSKRKSQAEGNESASKKFKVWLGKRKLGESDSEEDEDEGEDGTGVEQENEGSVIIDSRSNSDSSKEVDANAGEEFGVGSVEQGSSENDLEESLKSVKNSDECEDNDCKNKVTPVMESLDGNGSKDQIGVDSPSKSDLSEVQVVVSQHPGTSGSEDEVVSAAETRKSPAPESVSATENIEIIEKPLNFDDYISAAELEVLGLERIKSELQGRGLKCGGTLQERAARLFLLKTTPLEKLPKKLFAKK